MPCSTYVSAETISWHHHPSMEAPSTLIAVTMAKMGITATFVSPDATEEELNAAFRPNTKLMFG